MIGSIYKLVCSQSEMCYIGSTFNILKHRMIGHRSQYKRWDEGNTTSVCALYPYSRKYGPYEFKIMLIKQYDVADRHQLHAYETLWINNFEKTRVNRAPPFAPLKQRMQKETVKRYWRAYREEIYEKHELYNELHRDRRRSYHLHISKAYQMGGSSHER
ncbi:uncharacterized protein PITG_22420 [Phytophthora infestans T30-4]|uniref:Uncharacterized protein n=1 Tax=Phytophthora infestans (strain T30-4) TaxID=403677 RepID=D0RMA5_PHYIT|nr:uncharacterized protein PITG_22420 [Phytophthora infestans T30-4]EEY60726.1 conserved hypothetical protein [Phytophthora infestans T30-4]|eukprot:XP_002909825.1 conserved hypothetical protein [Phytophthora infestans T30-4]